MTTTVHYIGLTPAGRVSASIDLSDDPPAPRPLPDDAGRPVLYPVSPEIAAEWSAADPLALGFAHDVLAAGQLVNLQAALQAASPLAAINIAIGAAAACWTDPAAAGAFDTARAAKIADALATRLGVPA